MLIKELHKRFTEKHGSIICKDLLKLENSGYDSWEKAKDLFKTHCPKYVKDAVAITEEIVNKYAN